MGWRDKLQLDGKGSFRGTEFLVDSAETRVGRRTSLHEFPGSDHVEVEDMGRATRQFTFNAYLVGDDYMTPRDELIKAFETKGPGPLTHPYYGDVVVSINGQVAIRETTNEGGMCRFTLNVIRVTEDIVQVIRPDTAAVVDVDADAAIAALEEDFEDSWTVSGVIEAVRDAAQALVDGINGVTSTLNIIKGKVNAGMNAIDAVGDAITELEAAAAAIILLPAELAAEIQELISDITGTIENLNDTWDRYFGDDESAGSTAGTPSTSPTGATPASGDERASSMMKAYRDGADYGSGFSTVNETTPQREAEAGNQAAMIAFFRGVYVVETSRSMASVPFVSFDLSSSIRDELADALDDLADVADDVTYNALVDLRSSLVDHLTAAAGTLPRVVSYTPATQLPALVIAQILYGDSTKESGIIDRNNVRNPCRVPGGQGLEVLSDV